MMKRKIEIEENSILRKFFRSNKRYEEMIRENTQQLPKLCEEKGYKIKTVPGYKYCGETIYEYKIPLDRNIDCRAAYIQRQEQWIIFFISNTIVKKEFTKLLIKMNGVKKE